jgi:hypothetical protein
LVEVEIETYALGDKGMLFLFSLFLEAITNFARLQQVQGYIRGSS